MSIGVNGAASKNIRVMITHGVLDALDMLVKTCVPRNPLIGLCQRGPLGPRKAIDVLMPKPHLKRMKDNWGFIFGGGLMKETQVAETTLVAFSPEAGAGEGRNGHIGLPS